MLYLSDHGESLGENGLYLHGMPYSIAPESQTHIGAVMWFGDKISKHLNLDKVRLKKDARFSHDNLFHTLLGIFNVQTKEYKKIWIYYKINIKKYKAEILGEFGSTNKIGMKSLSH